MLESYKRDKVEKFVNSRKLLATLENVTDRKLVDELVEDGGLTEVGNPELQRMRESLGKGKIGTKVIVEESPPKNVKNELGQDINEMVSLAGIPIN